MSDDVSLGTSPHVQRLRHLLDRFKQRGSTTDLSLWMDFRSALERYKNLFKARSPQWWQTWASCRECSLLKQCMAEIISICPAAAQGAGADEREIISVVFLQGITLVWRASKVNGAADDHSEPWLREWLLTPGRWKEVVKATLAMASLPTAVRASPGMLGFGLSQVGVQAASQVIFMAALSASDYSTSEMLSIKTLIEVLGAALRVCIPLTRSIVQRVISGQSTQYDQGLFHQMFQGGISQNLGSICHLFLRRNRFGNISPAAAAAITATEDDDGGAWRKDAWRAIVPTVLQAYQLNLDVLSGLRRAFPEETAECCAKTLLISFTLLVNQAQVYLQGGFAQLKLALATIRVVIVQLPETPVLPVATIPLKDIFEGACQLTLAVIVSCYPESHLPEEREFGCRVGIE